MCPQIGSVLSTTDQEQFGKAVGTEDCLYLNIWAPATAQEGQLPVMFWIHGGGNSVGHGGSATYDGSRLASKHNVVVVSINYRLGPFGWFRHPALASDLKQAHDASGNYGTLDIVAALHWASRHLSRFARWHGGTNLWPKAKPSLRAH